MHVGLMSIVSLTVFNSLYESFLLFCFFRFRLLHDLANFQLVPEVLHPKDLGLAERNNVARAPVERDGLQYEIGSLKYMY